VYSRNFVGKYADGVSNAGSKAAAMEMLDDELEWMFENDRAFASDVAVAYAIETGMIDGSRGLSAKDLADANARMSDPKIREKAFNNYRESMRNDVNRLYDRGTSSKSLTSLPSYGDIYEDINVNMYALPRSVGNYSGVGTDAEGNYYVRTKETVSDGITIGGEIKPATEAQIAQIEAATKINIRGRSRGKSNDESVDREGAMSQAPVTLKEDIPIEESQIQAFIDSKSGGKSPITAKDIIDVSAKYNVPVEIILAQGAMESNFGTKGRAARTNNIFNVGNTTSGDDMKKDSKEQQAVSRKFDSWIDGLDAYASLMSRRYAPDGDWTKLLDNFVNDEGNRYATAEGYEDSLKNMIEEFYKMTPENSVSSQDGFDSQSARNKYNY
jgi:flagellum-specific peptidoglycan hydrolase FlgJ